MKTLVGRMAGGMALMFVAITGGNALAAPPTAPRAARPAARPAATRILQSGSLRVTGKPFQQTRRLASEMENDIRQGITPFLEIVPTQQGVKLRRLQWPDYHSGTISQFEVSGLGKGGELRLATLLPVSGHVGWENARRYAKSNRYNLVVTHADGTREPLPKIAATGFVTPAEIALPLQRGKTVIEFWPEDSGGVGGYVAGRRLELFRK